MSLCYSGIDYHLEDFEKDGHHELCLLIEETELI